MAGLTKEQRKAKAEVVAEVAAEQAPFVLMERDGKTTEVNNNESVAIMQALGWKLIKKA